MERDKQGKLLIKKFVTETNVLGSWPVIQYVPISSLLMTICCLIDAWAHQQLQFTINVEGKRNESGKTGLKLDKSVIHNAQLFLETLAWWTADEWWMLWRMSGGQREPAERSIVLRWPVKNSIIPRSHLWLAPFFRPVQPASTEQ